MGKKFRIIAESIIRFISNLSSFLPILYDVPHLPKWKRVLPCPFFLFLRQFNAPLPLQVDRSIHGTAVKASGRVSFESVSRFSPVQWGRKMDSQSPAKKGEVQWCRLSLDIRISLGQSPRKPPGKERKMTLWSRPWLRTEKTPRFVQRWWRGRSVVGREKIVGFSNPLSSCCQSSGL